MKKTLRNPKSPLGVIPKELWEERVKIDRLNELRRAIVERTNELHPLDPKWAEEYNELLPELVEDAPTHYDHDQPPR